MTKLNNKKTTYQSHFMYSTFDRSSTINRSSNYGVDEDLSQNVIPKTVSKTSSSAVDIFGKSYTTLLAQTYEKQKTSCNNTLAFCATNACLGATSLCITSSILVGGLAYINYNCLFGLVCGGYSANFSTCLATTPLVYRKTWENIKFLNACDKFADFSSECDLIINDPNKDLKGLIKKLDTINDLFKTNDYWLNSPEFSKFNSIKEDLIKFSEELLKKDNISNEIESIIEITNQKIEERKSLKNDLKIKHAENGKKITKTFKIIFKDYVKKSTHSW